MDTHTSRTENYETRRSPKYPPAFDIIKATMEELGDFISAQDLHLTLANRKEQVSLATTYRVLQSLANAGELDSVKGVEG